jgi:hypothetical protein
MSPGLAGVGEAKPFWGGAVGKPSPNRAI